MNKLNGFKMYAFNNGDVTEEKFIKDKVTYYEYLIKKDAKELKFKEVRLTENVLIKAYCIYVKKELKKDMLVTDIIKVMLSKGEEKSRREVKLIKFNNVEYVPWFSSVSGMKKEDRETASKSEWYFIRKDLIYFANWFEYIISLGQIENLNGKKICINKDIIARLSLATSSTYETKLIPKIIILPEASNIIKNDMVGLDIHNSTVIKIPNKENEVTSFDGCGLMSMKFAKELQDDMNLADAISFAGIRMYNGLAVKGLVTSVDFIGYFDEFYKGNTELFYKKEDGKFYCIDYFEEEQCLNDADLILNETQVKWAKLWRKQSQNLNNIYKTLNNKEFDKYRDLLSHLYVTKTNKADAEIKEFTLTNYQLLSNLAITEKEINTLSANTEKVYKEILNGNPDITQIFWGDIVKNYDIDINGNIVIEETDSMSTQAQMLLQINNSLIDIGYVRRAIARMITKKIKLLASGKFYIKGSYKTLTQDPISYMDWIMNRNKDNKLMNEPINGLKAHKFYCSDINSDEIRTISRCPLNSFSEIQNIKFDKNKIIDKYIGHFSKEICVFNCYDLTPMILSGCDFDLDGALIVNEEIIKNSVVEDLPLYNPEDGNKVEKEYTPENRIEATLKASGNLIGSLAMYGMSVCNHAQQARYKNYKCIKEGEKDKGKVYDYQIMWDTFKKKYQEEYKDNTYTKFMEILEKNFEEIKDYYSEEKLKKEIKKSFFNNKYRYTSYRLRNLQMKAIDAPKSLNMPTIPKYIKKEYKLKPRFMYYAKDYIKKSDTQNLHTALNLHANRVAKELLIEAYKQRRIDDKLYILEKYMLVQEYSAAHAEEYEKIKLKIKNLYEYYKENVIHSKYNQKMSEAKKLYNTTLDELKMKKKKGKITKRQYRKRVEELAEQFDIDKESIKNSLLQIKLLEETECILRAEKLLNKYKDKEYVDYLISNALIILKCSENFIFKFFFKSAAKVIEIKSINMQNYTYLEDKDGTIEYLNKKYKKVPVIKSNSQAIDKLQQDSKEQLFKKLSKQSKNGFTKEVSFYSDLKVEKLSKVTLKKGQYIDKKTKEKRSTVFLYDGNKKVTFIYPDQLIIDDFKNLLDYKDGTIVNFSFKERKKHRVKALLNYIG